MLGELLRFLDDGCRVTDEEQLNVSLARFISSQVYEVRNPVQQLWGRPSNCLELRPSQIIALRLGL